MKPSACFISIPSQVSLSLPLGFCILSHTLRSCAQDELRHGLTCSRALPPLLSNNSPGIVPQPNCTTPDRRLTWIPDTVPTQTKSAVSCKQLQQSRVASIKSCTHRGFAKMLRFPHRCVSCERGATRSHVLEECAPWLSV